MDETLPAPPEQPEGGLERFKAIVVYGTASIVVIGSLLVVTALMWFERIDEIAGMTFLTLLAGGAVAMLWGAAQSRATERAIERANIVARSTIGNGHTPTPNSTGGTNR